MERINEFITGNPDPDVHRDRDRCRSRQEQRERMELLRSRIELLKGREKALMQMYVENGISCRQLAQLSGVNEANIARRIEKLTRRLLDGEYIRCLRNREKFTRQEMAIARSYFVQGLSRRKIAFRLGVGVYRVRKSLRKIHRILNNSNGKGTGT